MRVYGRRQSECARESEIRDFELPCVFTDGAVLIHNNLTLSDKNINMTSECT